jgi:hypothetical protein
MKRNTTTFLVGLQILILMGQWFGNGAPTPALAQIADSGAQRSQMIQQLKDINDKLDLLVKVLGDGKLQVSLRDSDEKKVGN